jgi:hypothetical protein
MAQSAPVSEKQLFCCERQALYSGPAKLGVGPAEIDETSNFDKASGCVHSLTSRPYLQPALMTKFNESAERRLHPPWKKLTLLTASL